MVAGEQPHAPSGTIRWPDLNSHADAERQARHQSEERVLMKVEALAVRVDRIESILDQMKGIRALIVALFGTTVVGGLLGTLGIIAAINGIRP